MESLHDLSLLPDIEINRQAPQDHEDANFIAFSFINETDFAELNTINETAVDDYSQASTAPVTNSSRESETSQLVTHIAESPTRDGILNSQLEILPDMSVNFSRPSPSTPNMEELSDDEILPPSPNPPRTPSSKAASAFVTMATGSPVQGSLRTIRNVESTSGSASKVDKEGELQGSDSKDPAVQKETPVANSSSSEPGSSSKAMRQIHFESDNSSHSGTGESPSMFFTEPGHAPIDTSIPKPTFSRAPESNESKDDSDIQIVEIVERKPGDPPESPPNEEADSATPHFTPQLFPDESKKLSESISQEILCLSPSQGAGSSSPPSQMPTVVSCFETQELLRTRTAGDKDNDSLEGKMELSLESQLHPSNNVEQTSTPNQTVASLSMADSDVANGSKEDTKSCSDTVESDSSMEDASELVKEECTPFIGLHAFFNPTIKKWKIRTVYKDVPNDKFEVLDQGSIAQYLEMGLFDEMETEMHPGSRLERISDLVQKIQESSGYHGDVETSKSDSTSCRTSRLSVSTFEGGHLGVSTTSSRPSLELSALHASGSEFAVPKHPAVRQKMRSSSLEPVQSNSSATAPVGATAAEGEVLTVEAVSMTSLNLSEDFAAASSPEVEEAVNEVPPKSTSDDDQQVPVLTAGEVVEEAAEVKTVRKRGRKPKNLETTSGDSSDSSKAVPVKRGRRGRTPAIEMLHSATPNINVEPEVGNYPLQLEPPSVPSDTQNYSQAARTSELEAAQEWRDIRTRSIGIGSPVFAQWADKCYYAAKVIKRDSATAGKWQVQFEDGQSRMLVEEFILPIKILQKKQSIMVLNESLGEGRPAIIVGYHKDGDELQYSVEMDDGGTLMVPRRRICMTQDQVRLCHDSTLVSQLFSPATCSVSMDNIVTGRRRRVPNSIASPGTPQSPRAQPGTPTSSKTPRKTTPVASARKKLHGKRDVLLDSSTQSSSGHSMMLTQSQTEEEVEVGTLEHPEEAEELPVDVKRMGPLPKDKSIFKGLAFILTRTSKPLSLAETSVSGYQEPVPYHKGHIRKQLEAGGGLVLDRFDEAYMTADMKLLVVSNRPCRTERYIRSLAANIRAVSNKWVVDCCKAGPKGALLPPEDYYLDAGYDLDHKSVPWKSTTGRCLRGTRVLLAGSPLFNDLWQPILMEAQCNIVSRLPASAAGSSGAHDVEPESPDFILTTGQCPQKVVQMAQELNIPILSSEYIVQSLIHGQKLDAGLRAEFSYAAAR